MFQVASNLDPTIISKAINGCQRRLVDSVVAAQEGYLKYSF